MRRGFTVKGLFVGVFVLLSAAGAFGQIVGSAHDFSSQGWSNGEVCLPCHTPHNALTTEPDAPLWNHEVSTATYTLYSSGTMRTTPEQPRGVSKLCLSCHDGTVAIDSFGGATGTGMIAGAANLDTALDDDHPISLYWNHQNTFIGSGSCIRCHNPTPTDFNPILPFYDRYIECATCHDVHNGAGFPNLLRMTMTGSALCLQCHGK